MKHFLVYTVSYLSLVGTCYAQTCKTIPTCTELGYTTPANEAATKSKCLACPFDANYYYCPDLCWEYTLTSCSGSGCKKCDYGDVYRIEETAPICEYTSATLPAGCSIATDSCSKDGVTYYSNSCATCYTGYSLSSGNCSKTCTYTATSKPSNCKTVSSCQLASASGTTTYYKCTKCNDGYNLSSGYCSAINTCLCLAYSGIEYEIATDSLRTSGAYTQEECIAKYGEGYNKFDSPGTCKKITTTYYGCVNKDYDCSNDL